MVTCSGLVPAGKRNVYAGLQNTPARGRRRHGERRQRGTCGYVRNPLGPENDCSTMRIGGVCMAFQPSPMGVKPYPQIWWIHYASTWWIHETGPPLERRAFTQHRSRAQPAGMQYGKRAAVCCTIAGGFTGPAGGAARLWWGSAVEHPRGSAQAHSPAPARKRWQNLPAGPRGSYFPGGSGERNNR